MHSLEKSKNGSLITCESPFLVIGTTGVFFQLLLVIGILYAYCTGFTRSVVAISSLCCIPPIVFGVTMSFMPESPLFYLIKDREEDARRSMLYFRGLDYNIETEMQAFKVGPIIGNHRGNIDRRTNRYLNVIIIERPIKIVGKKFAR